MLLRVKKMFNLIRLTLALLSPTLSMLVEQHSDELEELLNNVLQFIANEWDAPQLEYLYLYSNSPSSDDSSSADIEEEEGGGNDAVVVQNHI